MMVKSGSTPQAESYLDTFDPELRRAYEFAEHTVDPEIVDRNKVKIEKSNILLSGDSTFYTLQGEGPTMGLPCVFCRLHVCNLRCTWCDAFYTWNPSSEEYWTESKRVSFNECANLIREQWTCIDSGVSKRVVFTGGEPLIQKTQIDRVWEILNTAEEWKVEIETNGTLMPTEHQLAKAQFNCSPKLSNSENKEYTMVKPKVLDALNKANTTFKFVCRSEADLDEIEEKYLDYIWKRKVIIMPEGIRSNEIDNHMKALYEPCMERGYRMMGRMQSQFADGARRGV